MSYQLIYTQSAAKQIAQLDPVVKKRLKKKFEYFQADPVKYAHKLVNYSLGQYRWRVGKYRIIFDIYPEEQQVVILRVMHRTEIYAN